MKTLIIIGLGFIFGVVLLASEAFHWFRIQEMFYFDSFHMYGVLFSAVITGYVSLWLIKRFKVKTANGSEIIVKKKPVQLFGNVIGGLFFGTGWALTGACTAPMFLLMGLNWKIGIIALTGACIGVFIYALIRKKLPQ